MINEGNSLRELQERVLRASPHETKLENLLKARLPSWHWDLIKQVTNANLKFMYPSRAGKSFMDQLLANQNKPSSGVYKLKGSAKATSVATSRSAGRRADIKIIDDILGSGFDAFRYAPPRIDDNP